MEERVCYRTVEVEVFPVFCFVYVRAGCSIGSRLMPVNVVIWEILEDFIHVGWAKSGEFLAIRVNGPKKCRHEEELCVVPYHIRISEMLRMSM